MIDTVRLNIKAGDGGNGCVSFRREKYKPRGGPDGGDGGNGGSAYICGDPSLNTLLHLKFHSTIYVQRGSHGQGKNRKGGNGVDQVIAVPVGTMVWHVQKDGSRELLADVIDTRHILVARGGRGGWGNSRYVSATNQEPVLVERGEGGEFVTLLLELKMLADVGIIARPNAGKSTLLARCSEASPRIADYPFTTVEPVLGVVAAGGTRFVMMEVPGLISGAHGGAGLGHQFLRHAERARLYLFLIDGLSEDPVADFHMLNNELRLFNPALSDKLQIIAVNKIDIPAVRERRHSLEKALREVCLTPVLRGKDTPSPSRMERGLAGEAPIYFISAVTGEGVAGLLHDIASALELLPKEAASAYPSQGVASARRKRSIHRDRVEVQDGVYVVDSLELERLVALADLQDYKVRLQLWKVMTERGIAQQLKAAGIQVGDTIRIGQVEMEWV